MDFRLLIVDDDRAVRRILAGIVENNNLGEVVEEAGNGEEAEKKIYLIQPDLVLIDLLLPDKDGIEVVRACKARNLPTQFIMISQVEAKDLVTRAYESGVEFFIHKPINVVEVVKVVTKVEEVMRLRTTFQRLQETFATSGFSEVKTPHQKELAKADWVLAELGLLGEAGCEDLRLLLQNYAEVKAQAGSQQDLYLYLQRQYQQLGRSKSSDLKAIEMRLRRTIQKALHNLAALGLEDYSSEQFNRYASTLFDFSEIKREMDFLRGKSKVGGKISIKKFLEGLALLCR